MRWLLPLVSCAGRDEGDPTSATAGVPVVVTDHGPVSCDAPAERDARRFDTLEVPPEAPKRAWFWGLGVIAADLTGDDLLDLVLPGWWKTTLWVGLPDGGWAEQPGLLPDTPNLLAAAAGGSAADYDGDGDLDLLITRFLARDVLLRNDGGVFVDATDEAGLSAEPRRSVTSSWADFDRDGDLDLHVGCYGWLDESGSDPSHTTFDPAEPDFLYVNEGDGTFTDRSDLLPDEVHVGYALSGGWHDLDRDGWPELYVVNDFGQSYPNHLLWNREGTLVSDHNAHGLDVAITGMGMGIGDVNADGVDDVVMTAWDGNSSMMSGAEAGAWFESVDNIGPNNALERGQKIAWGVDLADMDLDGDLDAPMTYGWLDALYESPIEQPDALYVLQDDGTFVDEAPAWGLDQPTAGRGFVAADVNGDGWLDLVRRDLLGPTLYSRSRCGEGSWLRIRLRQPGANRFAIGARVLVGAGDRTWDRVVLAGGTNLASSGPPEVHFGLAGLDEVDWIEVRWPDGEVSRLFDVATRRVLDVERP